MVMNDGKNVALACRVFLVGLVKLKEGIEEDVGYHDALEFAWAYSHQKAPSDKEERNIYPKVNNCYVNLCRMEMSGNLKPEFTFAVTARVAGIMQASGTGHRDDRKKARSR